jgi:hypothetical protein
MSKLLLPFVFGYLLASASAQTISVDVNGIDIGSSRSEVQRRLGKPVSSRIGGIVPCNDGSIRRTLRYPGLIMHLESSRQSRDFGVYDISVTSARWSIAGIKIGATRSAVVAKFGNGRVLRENGKPYLTYFIKDGYASFYFTNNRLTKVFWEFNFC